MTRAKSEDLRLCSGLGFSQICGGKYKIRILWILTKRSYRYGKQSVWRVYPSPAVTEPVQY